MVVVMANLKVICNVCLETLRRVPRQAASVAGTLKMQGYYINAVSTYHDVLFHVMGNDDAFFFFHFCAFLLASHNFILLVCT